jgi:uridine kinase
LALPQLIGIAGGTGAGKSTLVNLLHRCLDEVCVVDLDSYYVDRAGTVSEELHLVNYDEPDAIDLALLLEHLGMLVAGEPVRKPMYSFERHRRVGAVSLQPGSVIIVEGLFALWWEDLRLRLDLKVFVDAPSDVRLGRRILRDVVERGRSVDRVLEQYFRTVRPMHERYVEPTRDYADVVVLNVGPEVVCLEAARAIERALATCGTANRARSEAAGPMAAGA